MDSACELSSDTLLDLLTQVDRHDWKRSVLNAELIAEALRAAVERGITQPLTFVNARIEGDIRLEGLGFSGSPVALQMLGCVLKGAFAAPQSRWLQLVIAATHVRSLDLPAVLVEQNLLVEQVVASEWLEMRGAEVGRTLSLSGSAFSAGSRAAAVNLDDVRTGRNLKAIRLRATGGLDAERVRVGGDLRLDGANLTADTYGRALGLSQARIEGRLRLCQAGQDRFVANGRVHLDGAEIGALLMRSASLNGLGGPAIVADELRVEHAVDLSGAEQGAGERFQASGALRFGSARIGGQFQLHAADLHAASDALVLQGAHVVGDVLLGHESAVTKVAGTLNLNSSGIGGRLVATKLRFTGSGDALAVRQANVAGDVVCYDVRANGPIRMDNLTAAGISVEGLCLDRDLPDVDITGLPESYAHAEHAILDVSFAKLETDLRLEQVTLRGGDLRMIGVKVGTTAQISRLDVLETSGAAIIAQSADIGAGLLIAGSPDRLSVLHGDFNGIGLRTGEGVTFAHARFAAPGRSASVVLRSARLSAGMTLVGVEVEGALIASAASLGGDLHIHDSCLSRPGAVALDLRGAIVSGQLQLASLQSKNSVCRLNGQVTLENAALGSLGWERLMVGEGSLLLFAHVVVAQRISAGRLLPEGGGHISLAGTTTPLLDDNLGDEEDGWGAGRLTLDLDEFGYGRLVHPSGRDSDAASVVREWRSKWLARRADQRSARPLRHLANVLRTQGLVEASRLQLVDAFSAEGRARPTPAGRGMSWLFGLLFGHGLSGSRAVLTLIAAWLIGVAGVAYLQDRNLLIPTKQDEKLTVPCDRVDPSLFAADAMLPLDLGANAGCTIGKGPHATARGGVDVAPIPRKVLGEIEIYRFAAAAYQLLSWILISLAVLTWSGLLKRGGRE